MTDLQAPSAHEVAQQRTRNVLSGSTVLFGARALGIVANLVTIGILTRALGREEFGLWSVIGTFVGFAGNFDFGLGQGLKNKLAALAAREKRDPTLEAEAFFFVLAFLVLVALAGAVLVGGLAGLVPWGQVLGVQSAALEGPAHAAVVAVLVLLLLNLPLNLNQAGFLAYQEAARRGLFDILQTTLLLLGVVVLATLVPIAQFIAAYYVLFNLAALVALVAFVRHRRWSLPRLEATRVWQSVKELAISSVQFWLLGVSAIALFTTDPLIAARVVGLIEAGDFSILQKLLLLFISLHFTVLMPLWSAYTHAAETQDWSWIRNAFNRSIHLTVGLFVVGGTLAVLFHAPLLRLWTGRTMDETLVVTLLALWATLYAWINCQSVLLNGLGLLSRQVAVIVLCAILHVPLSYYLGQHFGLEGVALGALMAIVPLAISNSWQVHHLLKTQGQGL